MRGCQAARAVAGEKKETKNEPLKLSPFEALHAVTPYNCNLANTKWCLMRTCPTSPCATGASQLLHPACTHSTPVYNMYSSTCRTAHGMQQEGGGKISTTLYTRTWIVQLASSSSSHCSSAPPPPPRNSKSMAKAWLDEQEATCQRLSSRGSALRFPYTPSRFTLNSVDVRTLGKRVPFRGYIIHGTRKRQTGSTARKAAVAGGTMCMQVSRLKAAVR